MCRRKLKTNLASLISCLLAAAAGSAWCGIPTSQRAAQLLPLALHSVDGPKLTRSSLKEVLYRPGRKEIYLVTKSNVFVSFYIMNSKAFTYGQSKLVSSTSPNGSPPTGSIGDYFEAHGQRISNIATGPKGISLLPFLNDLDDPDPVYAYKALPNGTLLPEKARPEPPASAK